jgi:hypothetical protein
MTNLGLNFSYFFFIIIIYFHLKYYFYYSNQGFRLPKFIIKLISFSIKSAPPRIFLIILCLKIVIIPNQKFIVTAQVA